MSLNDYFDTVVSRFSDTVKEEQKLKDAEAAKKKKE